MLKHVKQCQARLKLLQVLDIVSTAQGHVLYPCICMCLQSAYACVSSFSHDTSAIMQDKLKEAADRAADRATAPAAPEQGKLATRLRAELEVHKEALAAAKEEAASLASSLEKANSWIEVSGI